MKTQRVPHVARCAAMFLAAANVDATAQTSTGVWLAPLRVIHLEKSSHGWLQPAPPPMRLASLTYGVPVTNFVFGEEWPPPDGEDSAGTQPPARPPPVYDIDHWTVEQGLPANKIRSLFQTRDGFLWIGTVNGLARFDGVRFTPFTATNCPELAENGQDGRSFFEDETGRLWIGTGRGLLCREAGGFVNFPGQESLRSGRVNGLAGRSQGGFWIAHDRGLACWDGRAIRWLETPEINRPFCLAEDDRSSLWIGGLDGLHEYDVAGGRVARSLAGEELHGVPEGTFLVTALQFDPQGRLWVGLGVAPTPGVDVFPKPRRFGAAGPALLLLPNWARFSREAQGTVWSISQGTPSEVLGFFGSTETPARVVLDTTELHSVLADREGSVWVGSRDGLFRLKRRRFATFQMREPWGGLVQSVAVDHQDRFWFGTEAWCGRWSGLDLLLLSHRDLPIGARVLAHQRPSENTLASGPAPVGVPRSGGSYAPPPEGGTPNASSQAGDPIWADAKGRGVFSLSDYYFDPRVSRSAAPLFPEAGEVRVILAARDGRTWIGSREGLFTIEGTSLTRKGRVEIGDVRSLLEDQRGALWIGTGQGEVFRHDAAGLYPLLARETSDVGAVLCFHESADRNLWLGTEKGLYRVKDGTLETFGSQAGVPGDAIDGILEDQFGRLWLGRKHGISRVARRDLEVWLLDRSALPEIAHFGRDDGILSVEPANGTPTCARASDGRLWFARREGIAVVDPAECPPGLPAPQVWIERPGTPPHHVVSEGEVKLPPGSGRHLELQFSATTLHSPDRALVEYRLDGHDHAWRKAGRERKAAYTNLRPGSYQLRVRAQNHEGRRSEREAVLAITLRPFFWQTWTFRGAGGLALLGGAAGLVRWRLRRQHRLSNEQKLREMEAERSRIARDLHDHFGARLTEILLTRTRAEQPRHGDARAALSELKDLVWSVHPENDSLPGLAEFLADFSTRYLAAAGLELTLDLPLDVPELHITGRLRSAVAAVFKEALRNVVQHARARKIHVGLRVAADQFTLSVRDDGCGFDSPGLGREPDLRSPSLGVPPFGDPDRVNTEHPAKSSPRGNGLQNFRARCAELGGRCRIESVLGQGTTVEFTFPLRHDTPPAAKKLVSIPPTP